MKPETLTGRYCELSQIKKNAVLALYSAKKRLSCFNKKYIESLFLKEDDEIQFKFVYEGQIMFSEFTDFCEKER